MHCNTINPFWSVFTKDLLFTLNFWWIHVYGQVRLPYVGIIVQDKPVVFCPRCSSLKRFLERPTGCCVSYLLESQPSLHIIMTLLGNDANPIYVRGPPYFAARLPSSRPPKCRILLQLFSTFSRRRHLLRKKTHIERTCLFSLNRPSRAIQTQNTSFFSLYTCMPVYEYLYNPRIMRWIIFAEKIGFYFTMCWQPIYSKWLPVWPYRPVYIYNRGAIERTYVKEAQIHKLSFYLEMRSCCRPFWAVLWNRSSHFFFFFTQQKSPQRWRKRLFYKISS